MLVHAGTVCRRMPIPEGATPRPPALNDTAAVRKRDSPRTFGYPETMAANADPEEGAAGDPLLMAVGARIRELREAAGLAPADFSRAAGFSLQYLWRLERGQQNLNLRSISRLALALGVEMAAILEGIPADPATLAKRSWTPRGRTSDGRERITG